MSDSANRPELEDDSAIRSRDTEVPVTPSIRNGASEEDPISTHQAGRSPPAHIPESVGADGASKYINPEAAQRAGVLHARRPSSPHEVAKGARTGAEILRRLSLAGQRMKPSVAALDPQTAHPALNLSGNVISAAVCVPYKIGYTAEGQWDVQSRRGTSALFDSFAHLASTASPWNHTLLGWTGEIDRPAHRVNVPGKAEVAAVVVDPVPLNRASAPIPATAHEKQVPSQEHNELQLSLSDRKRLEVELSSRHKGRIVPVWLHDGLDESGVATFRDQRKWRRYGEHELFTLFHYKQNEPSDGRALKKAWKDYYAMNKAFADAIISVYKPGDIVMVHDYHLLLVPSLLRQRLPNVYIGFFLHIPFPSSEYYKCLTRRKEIMEGVLGANMIGFQANSYARHFSSCATRILGFESSSAGVDAYGAHVPVDIFPIGINADQTLRSAFGSPAVDQKVKALRELYAGKKIIVGRDRLDVVRGVAQKLQAFEIFLERHPEWQEKVVLIQVTSPTSIEERDDRGDKLANKISELVARINGTFGSLSFTPVQHYPQYLSQEEYFALLRIADLGLITSVRDGMNTTALEYVICQRDNHGPLIISEFSGTAGSLANAIHINPWDLAGTADIINKALTMSEEDKSTAHDLLYKHVTGNTVQAWTDSYLKRLLTNLASYDQVPATPALNTAQLLKQYRTSTRRLFMFDYDGTLTPIVSEPKAAIPSDRVIRNLKTLASDPNNHVWIISGRDQAFLKEWFGHIPELGLSAEHGCFMRNPNCDEWEDLTTALDLSWQKEVEAVFKHYEIIAPGSWLEPKEVAMTWHYRKADRELGESRALECRKQLEDTVMKKYDVEVMNGKYNLEVRPRFINKGEIAKRLVHEFGEGPEKAPNFVLCLGDDFTDEDMFRTLRQSNLPEEHRFAVTVGAKTKQTLATWHLLEPADVISALALLNGAADTTNIATAAVVDGVTPAT